MTKAILTAALWLATICATAQWSDHYFMGNCTFVGTIAGKPFAGNTSGLFINNTSDNTLEKITKTNHLSDIGITAACAFGTELYIGYKNGTIDIFDYNEYRTTSIPELKQSENILDKAVNCFTKSGRYVYCGTNRGIFVIDSKKAELKEHYRIRLEGAKVNSIATTNDTIYAATSNGLYCASKNGAILEDHNQWQLVGNNTAAFYKIIYAHGKLIAVQGSAGGNNSIYEVHNGKFTKLTTISQFRSIAEGDDSFVISTNSTVRIYNTDFVQTATIDTFYNNGDKITADIRSAQPADRNTIAIADATHGLVLCDTDGNCSTALPNGPSSNYNHKLLVNKNGVFCTMGGLTSADNNSGYRTTVHYLRYGKWSSTSTSYSRDAINICCDPNAEDSLYISTWGGGIIKVDSFKLTTIYNPKNSPLQDIFGGSSFIRVNAIAYDDHSNLYISNSERTPGIWVKTPEGEWGGLSYPASDNVHGQHDYTITSNGNIWVTMPRATNRFMVFNTNGTPLDDTDDLFRCSTNYSSDTRFCGEMHLWDSDFEVISDRVNIIKEDLNGQLWFGTNNGIATFSNDKRVFSLGTITFNRIKVPRNDGTNNADYLLDGVIVSDIAIDGANRKWIGTKGKGIFLVSADGTKTIKAFDTQNSPLPSDNINSIAIDPRSGEVYIGTENGIVSYMSDAIRPEETLSSVKVYPNPVLPPYGGSITMKGFTADAVVRITDINGRAVHATTSMGGMATWDGKNADGQRVDSGTYIIWACSADGTQSCVGKILIVR